MRELQLQDGRTCMLHGTGVRSGPAGVSTPAAGRPEIVEYMLRGAAGRCTLPGDWVTHGVDDLRTLVESAARFAITGAVRPFDGPNGAAIRDVAIAAARMPIARLRALARIGATYHAEQRTVDWLVQASGERAHAARRLPAYLTAAAEVVRADAEAPEDDGGSAAEVAAAIGPAAVALLVCERPRLHDHSTLARAYRALVTPFQE